MAEGTKKIILWSVTIIIGGSLLFWWVKNVQKISSNFKGSEFIEKLNFPKIEMPNIESTKEDFKNQINELEEIIKNAQEISTTTE